MRIAYADPPYIGQARKHYKREEVDHRALIEELCTFDGWALSLSSPSLKDILVMCPESVRVMAWIKPFCLFKPGVNPAYAWEPVIVSPARKPNATVTVRDWVSANITLRKGLSGAKPDEFCYWLFEVLGIRNGDEFVDMYPGTGRVMRAWEVWNSSRFPAWTYNIKDVGSDDYDRGGGSTMISAWFLLLLIPALWIGFGIACLLFAAKEEANE